MLVCAQLAMLLGVAVALLLPAVARGWRRPTPQPCVLDGQQCVEHHMAYGLSYCKSTTTSTKRTGSCPRQLGWGHYCRDNGDCPGGQRCCAHASNRLARCQTPVPCPSAPEVTIVRNGSQSVVSPPPALAMRFVGSVAVVRSAGCRNVLFDSGGYADKIAVLSALRNNAGLYADDIDYVVTSHGHPDHIANINLFPRAVGQSFFSFTLDKDLYNANSLFAGQTFNPFDDRNLQVIPTVGHTAQDISLIVRNSNLGSVALVGDLLLDENDFDQQNGDDNDAIMASRRRVICDENVDYILPGHGSLFRVTPEYRQRSFQC